MIKINKLQPGDKIIRLSDNKICEVIPVADGDMDDNTVYNYVSDGSGNLTYSGKLHGYDYNYYHGPVPVGEIG